MGTGFPVPCGAKSASGALNALEDTDADTQQRSGDKDAQQRIADNHVKHIAYQSGDSLGTLQNSSNRISSLLNNALLL